MKWSWKLGKVAGIQIQVHATFPLLLGWVAYVYYQAEPTLLSVLSGLTLVLTVFAIVVLHEMGHALMARQFGIKTRDITLLPIGGVARLERMPEKPLQELLVALAGPAVNVLLAGMFFAALLLIHGWEAAFGLTFFGTSFLAQLVWINVALVVFNMLPAFPMDGGRALRAVLALIVDRVKATQMAAAVGQGMAMLLGFVGLLYNPILVLIAVFVWLGAGGEAALVQIRHALRGVPVRMAMITEFHVLHPSDQLARPVDLTLAGFQQDFPVVDEVGSVLGILTQPALLKALATSGPQGLVSEAMERDFDTTLPAEMLLDVFGRLQERRCRTLPVLDGDQLVGLVTMENIGELLTLKKAIGRSTSDAGRPPGPRGGGSGAPSSPSRPVSSGAHPR